MAASDRLQVQRQNLETGELRMVYMNPRCGRDLELDANDTKAMTTITKSARKFVLRLIGNDKKQNIVFANPLIVEGAKYRMCFHNVRDHIARSRVACGVEITTGQDLQHHTSHDQPHGRVWLLLCDRR
jgi:hypothetical protein